VNLADFRKQLDEWTAEAGTTYELVNHPLEKNIQTDISNDSFWFQKFKQSFDEM
jgi:hypothetical protein